MRLTPLDIQQQRFTLRFRGFDVREVDLFLEQMANSLEQLQRENETFKEEIRRLRLESQGYRKREETFKRAMIHSQKVLEHMKANAEKNAELIIAEAELKADKIVNHAQGRLTRLMEEIAEFKRQRVQIESEIRAVIDTHGKLLDISRDSVRALDEVDGKLAVLGGAGG
jgi:cell division initiation protein